MNQHRSPELYSKVITPEMVASLSDEAIRRSALAPLLDEISEEFDASEKALNPVTEPSLMAKSFALSMVQRSPMGVVGFQPSGAFDYKGNVTAKIAPSHGVVEKEGSSYRTRVININFRNEQLDDEPVAMFGINIYAPDMEETLDDGNSQQLPTILVVDTLGHAVKREQAVSGETPIIAVCSRETEDAKIYHVRLISIDQTTMNLQENIRFLENGMAHVRVPDGQIVEVTQLTGGTLNEAVNEFEAAHSVLKDVAKTTLTSEEQAAARSVGVYGNGLGFPFS